MPQFKFDELNCMTSMPKVVVSTTLTEPEWHNTTVISSDVAAQVRR